MQIEPTEPVLSLRRRSSLRSQVENFLRDAIVNGRFKPGERLRERELCDLLDISRPSLREALRILEAEKLIKTVMHRGPMVAVITLGEARELYAVRALLESHAAHEFTRLASDSQIIQLGRAVQNLHAAAAAAGNRKRLLAAKTRFYDAILDNCGNQLIKEMLLALLSRINLLRAASLSRPDRLAESLAEITRLFTLIQARDAIGARDAARLHIVNAEKAALAVLHQQTLCTPHTPTKEET